MSTTSKVYSPEAKLPINQPEEYQRLSQEDQEALQLWIDKEIEAARLVYKKNSSYGLKHGFEEDTGIYVCNGAFKGAMLAAGYEPTDKRELNWHYRIRVKSKRVW